MVLDADFSVHWRCIDAVKTLLCPSSSNSIYRCYIEDAIAISFALGKCSHRKHDRLCFSCPCSDVQLLLFWTINSTLIGIQDGIIMEETTLEGMRTLQSLHDDTLELHHGASNTLKYCKCMYVSISKENKSHKTTYWHHFQYIEPTLMMNEPVWMGVERPSASRD